MDIQELCCNIVSLGDWTTLVIWSNVNRNFRRAAQTVVRIHARQILGNFIPDDHHNTFWRLLEKTGGCVMGAVVKWIIMAMDHDYHDALPDQLAIVLPSTLTTPTPLELWTHFLRSQSYLADYPPRCVAPYDRCTREVAPFTKHVSVNIIT